ncbi:MAG: TlpA family protein disulfide reductase [Flavobacteriaceae bacterium]|nr:TlpA family protein disulfide reductase [Flavobacteriaceae bacterium]
MKNILATFVMSLVLISCKEEAPKDYATVSGKISNIGEHKTLTIFNRAGFKRDIAINSDGSFSDTLKVEEGKYNFNIGNEYGSIFLKNDNTCSFTLDHKDFDNTLKFTGDASNKNNFMIATLLLEEKYLSEKIFDGDATHFDNTFAELKDAYEALKSKAKIADTAFINSGDKDFEETHKYYKNYHNEKLELQKTLPKGHVSPIFENYENFAGGTTSLSDLKGKYVYIDVWATWCGPCKQEIPSLKEVEKKYHGKNIEFVSISIDDARANGSDEKANASWRKMVTDKALSGVQLFSDKGWQSDFVKNYKIKGIPRFILIDPDGNIISPDAPRPSSDKLIELFDTLDI